MRAIQKAALAAGVLPAPPGARIRKKDMEYILVLARREDPSVTRTDVWKFLVNAGLSIEPEAALKPRRVPPVEVERIVADVVSDVLTRHGLPQSHRVKEYLPFWPIVMGEALAIAAKRLSAPPYRGFITSLPFLVKAELERRGFSPQRQVRLRFWGKRGLPGYVTSPFQAPKGVRTRNVLPKERLVPRFRLI